MLGEFLEENCPDVTVKVVIKSNEDWTEFIDSVSEYYSLSRKQTISVTVFKTLDCLVCRFAAHTVSMREVVPSSTPSKGSVLEMDLTSLSM